MAVNFRVPLKAERLWVLLAFMCALAFSLPAGAAEYRISVGDTLEFSATSIPDFRHRAIVGPEGDVRFPMVGQITARGKTVNDLLKVLQDRVPTKILRRRGDDGREYDVVIDKDDISLVVAEYGPIYIKGDVSKAGSYPYRPGITVRQAISLAGGFGILRNQVENPEIMAADLRSQNEALTNDYARDQARVERIQAELGRDFKAVRAPDPSPAATDVKALQTEELDTSQADFEREKKYLTESIQSLGANLELLEKQMKTESERAKIDQDDLDRVEGLVEKGMAPITRLSDTKRLVLLSASRATEIETRTQSIKQQRAEQQRKLQRLIDQRRVDLLKELQEIKVRMVATSAKLSSITEKMFYLGASPSQFGRTGSGNADLKIYRKTDGSSEVVSANEEMELLPNDVLEVALIFDRGVSESPQTPEMKKSAENLMGQMKLDLERRLREEVQAKNVR